MISNRFAHYVLIQTLILMCSLHPLMVQASRTTGIRDSLSGTLDPSAVTAPVQRSAVLMRPTDQENVYKPVCYSRELTGLNPDTNTDEQASNTQASHINLPVCAGAELAEIKTAHNMVMNSNQYAALPWLAIAWGFSALAVCYQAGKQTEMIGEYFVRDFRQDNRYAAQVQAWEQAGKPTGKEPKRKPVEMHEELGDADLFAYYALDMSAFAAADAIRRGKPQGLSTKQALGDGIIRGTAITAVCAVGGAVLGGVIAYITE